MVIDDKNHVCSILCYKATTLQSRRILGTSVSPLISLDSNLNIVKVVSATSQRSFGREQNRKSLVVIRSSKLLYPNLSKKKKTTFNVNCPWKQYILPSVYSLLQNACKYRCFARKMIMSLVTSKRAALQRLSMQLKNHRQTFFPSCCTGQSWNVLFWGLELTAVWFCSHCCKLHFRISECCCQPIEKT